MEHQSYAALSDGVVRKLLEAYSLGNLAGFTQLDGGNANSNYRLETTSGIYLLKVCDEKPTESLKVQVRTLNLLRSHHFPTCYPVAQTGGEDYIYINENLRVIIYDWLPGAPGSVKASLSEKASHSVGASLGALHLIPPPKGLPEFPMGVAEIDPFLDEIKDLPLNSHPFVSFLKEQLSSVRDTITDPSLSKGILHADLFADNVMFKDDEVSGVIDFEEVCIGPVLLDVGMMLVGCCFNYASNQIEDPLTRAALQGYNSKRKLSSSDLSLLPTFVTYAALAIAFWRFRQHNHRYLNPDRKDDYKQMEERIVRFQARHIDFSSLLQ